MQTIELKIAGMSCGSCVAAVTRALKRVPGVSDVAVDLASGRARVQGEQVAQRLPELSAALAEAGYPAGQGSGGGAAASPASGSCGAPAETASKGRGCCCGGSKP